MKAEEYVGKFIKNLATENYANARENLRSALSEKIKARIHQIVESGNKEKRH